MHDAKIQEKSCEKSDKNQCLNSKEVLELMYYAFKRTDQSFSLSSFMKVLDKLENLIVLLMRTFFSIAQSFCIGLYTLIIVFQ